MVFTRRGDRAGSTAFDGAEAKTWNTLKFVPPPLTAPAGIQLLMPDRDPDRDYVLADSEGRELFTEGLRQDHLQLASAPGRHGLGPPTFTSSRSWS